MINKHRIAARLRRFHVEFEDDMGAALTKLHVKENHPQREIVLLTGLNAACKRLNAAYSHRNPNHAHIGRALRDASKMITDIEKHRVGRYMPQGVEDVPRYRPRQVSTEQLM